MGKLVKILLVFTVLIIAIGFGVRWYAQYWLNNRFPTVINNNPDRDYDILFESVSLNVDYRGLELVKAEIIPLKKDLKSLIHGSVERIELDGFSWRKLIFDEEINVSAIEFEGPVFDILLADQDKEDAYEVNNDIGLQNLFGDILSRGELSDFRLIDGAASIGQVFGSDTLSIGSVGSINIKANDIETDSVLMKYAIPFMMGGFSCEIGNIQTELDAHQSLSIGQLSYDSEQHKFSLQDVAMPFNKSALEVSHAINKQVDLIELELTYLEISELDAISSFFGEEVNIQAQKLLIDGLNMKDFRDKNKQRPADFEKPMFEGMVEAIGIPLKVDTVEIKNTNISYTELPPAKTESGTVSFNNVFASIYNVTTIDKYKKKYGIYEADIIATINNNGKLALRLEVPYSNEYFDLLVELTELDMSTLNQTLNPLADVEVYGNLKRLRMTMEAERTYSNNTLIMNYDRLRLSVLGTSKKDKRQKKKKIGLTTSIANGAIRRQNRPGEKNYLMATYKTTRNVERGPFNFMWQTLKEGMTRIIPARTVQSFIHKKPKSKEK